MARKKTEEGPEFEDCGLGEVGVTGTFVGKDSVVSDSEGYKNQLGFYHSLDVIMILPERQVLVEAG